MSVISKLAMMSAAAPTGPKGAWDLSYAYYDDPFQKNISTLSYRFSKDVSAQDTNLRDVYVSPDGTKMYTVGTTNDRVYEYTLSTPFYVLSATFIQSFSVASQDNTPSGLSFKPDGTKMYIVGASSDRVSEYDLSTAWDISTASYSQQSIVVGGGIPSGLFFRNDGEMMYVADYLTDRIYQYSLSTAWDVSTVTLVNSLHINAEATVPYGIFFSDDGTKMYVCCASQEEINEYDLSTPWDVTTASYLQLISITTHAAAPTGIFITNSSVYVCKTGSPASIVQYAIGGFSVASQETFPSGVFFKFDGSEMYVIGSTGDDVNQYTIDVSIPFSVIDQEVNPQGVFFKTDGTKMYVIGTSGDDVNEYDLSTAWDITTASYLQNFSVATQETGPSDVFFKPDGTKMYVSGFNTDAVYEYDLSSAWDVSTASYLQSFSVSSEDLAPQAIFFKSDGTKMYVLGGTGVDVNEYDLSTAWDITTASYLQNFSVSAEETAPRGVSFKSDGTKMYIVGFTGDDVNEYDLSTAWDISTASYLQNFSVKLQDGTPTGLFFKPDGTKMYVIGAAAAEVNEYDLSSAWNISTAQPNANLNLPWNLSKASYLQNFSVASQDIAPTGLFFKPDGTKMYITGAVGLDVNEYDLSTAWNVSTASYVQNFSVSTEDSTPTGLFFKTDGTKMYVMGNSSDAVYEYDLSSAWDISTASYLQNFSVASQDTSPSDVFFKSDGTKMYIVGAAGDDVNEYDLSTPWDVTTASYLQNFSVYIEENTPQGIFFKPDGTQMFIVGSNTDRVYSYTLGVQP